jgi:hypothetical protein
MPSVLANVGVRVTGSRAAQRLRHVMRRDAVRKKMTWALGPMLRRLFLRTAGGQGVLERQDLWSLRHGIGEGLGRNGDRGGVPSAHDDRGAKEASEQDGHDRRGLTMERPCAWW